MFGFVRKNKDDLKGLMHCCPHLRLQYIVVVVVVVAVVVVVVVVVVFVIVPIFILLSPNSVTNIRLFKHRQFSTLTTYTK